MDNQITHALMNNINFNDANSLKKITETGKPEVEITSVNKCTDIKHLCKSFQNVKNSLCIIDILNIVRLKPLISLEET